MVSMDQPRRERLDFEDFRVDRFPNGQSRIQVRVGWTEGRTYSGEAEGNQTLEGELRAAAMAAVDAVAGATHGVLELELRGAKGVRMFDVWIVVVMIRASAYDGHRQLIGAMPCPDEDTARGAALAVLDATNRLVNRFLPK
jgi:hypothetical protein